MRFVVVIALAACGTPKATGTLAALRTACSTNQYWNGSACVARADLPKLVAEVEAAVKDADPDRAARAFTAAERSGPVDHASNVTLWEQRGILAGFLSDTQASKSAFDMLLSLDPGHLIDYGIKPEVTSIFEAARTARKKEGAPELDVAWPSGLATDDAVPLDIEVLADPKNFLRKATVFVRARGDSQWRAADLTLAPKTRVVIPPVNIAKPTALELYLQAYDDKGNEVLAWSDPTKPREIPLRYDPPPKWYRNWKTYAIGGTAAVLLTGLVVYAVTLSPPDEASGSGVVK